MADVAAKAGVSVATVSYVVNGMREQGAPTRISAETAERVHAAMRDVGYTVNVPARSLRRQRTDRVIFLAARFSSPYSHALAVAIQEQLRPRGLSVDVHIGSETEDIRLGLSMLDQHLADGLIVEAGDQAVPILQAAAQSRHAVVVVGPTRPDTILDVVVYDETEAIRDGIAHLAHRVPLTYALFSRTADDQDDSRAKIARNALSSLGVAPDAIRLFVLPHDREAAFDLAMNVLPGIAKPVAIYAASDVSAIGVIWACQHLGLRVPDDVAVLGHGDIGEASISFPRLTTLGPTTFDLSDATNLLLSRLDHQHGPGRSEFIPWRLVIRDST